MLDDSDRLAEYCRLMPFSAEDCPQLSRIVFSVTEGDDAVWPVLASSTAQFGVAVVSPALAAEQEACMRWEFTDGSLAGVNALRLALSWQLTEGAADSSLSVVHGGAVHLPRVLAAAGGGASDELLWAPYVPAAPNYWLRFCYRPGEQDAGRMGAAALTRLGLWRFRVEFDIAAPTVDNRLSDSAGLRGHRLLLALRLQALSPTGNDRNWGIGDAESPLLSMRSRFDFVYTGAESALLRPLPVALLVVGGTVESDTALWLPQSRRSGRQQHFELLTPNGLLLSSSSITVPAVAADDSDALLNRFCAQLLAAGETDGCERLVLPGNGSGDWRINTSSVSVPYSAPPAAVDGSCLRLLVGESAESGWVRVGFVWRGPGDATARLVFHGDSEVPPSRRVAPSSGAPVEVSLLLPLRSEGQLLNWCIEDTQTTANPDVWGLFQPLSVEYIVREEISDRGQIAHYCFALDLSPQSCARLSAVVEENGQSFSGAVWDPSHPTVAPRRRGGNNVSLASRSDGRVGPSCLALQFDPPWPPFTALSFWWDLGHSGGGDAPAGVQVLLNHGPGDAFEFAASGYPRSGIRTRVHSERGFAGWYRHRWVTFPEPIAELKWCHYEEPGSGIPRPDSIARVDQLELIPQREVVIADRERIGEYCNALDLLEWGCSRIGHILFEAAADATVIWDAEHAASSPEGGGISAASRSAGSSEVSCMALQFDPPLPPYTDLSFWWDLGHSAEEDAPAAVQVLLNHGPGDAFEFDVSGKLLVTPRSRRFEGPGFAGWARHRWADFADPLAGLKWCYYEEPSTGRPRPDSIARIDRLQLTPKTRTVVTAPDRLGEYCDALDAPQWLCGRISRIVLTATGGEAGAAWSVESALGSPDGDIDSLVSLPVGAGNYSCMSLHFSPPLAVESAIAFDWAVGGDGRLQLWAPPPVDHLPATAATVPFIADQGGGVATWSSHSFSVAGESLGELRWCYFGASSTSGTNSVGRVDRLRVDSNIAVLDDRERLAEYCRLMPFAAEDCPQLSRIVFSVTDADDAVWPVVPSSTAQFGVAVVSPALAAEQEACMRWEFADGSLAGVNALRLALSWGLMESTIGSLSAVYGGAAHLPRVLAETGGRASDELLWVPYVPAAPNYWLRFCYRPGEQDAGRMGAAALTRIGLWRFRAEFNIAAPTVDNRLSDSAGLRGHRLLLSLRLQALSPTGGDRNWGIGDAESPLLSMRSRFDFVYTGAESALLRPLPVALVVVGGTVESDTALWLPQSRRIGRQQHFELLTPNGLLLSSSSITVPAVAADDSDALLSRFCAELLAVGDTASCEHLVLPGNGTGDWRLSTGSVSVPYIAPPAAVDGSCLRLLVDESADSGWVRVGFVWRGPSDSTARLVFHVDSEPPPSRRVAPSSGAPVELSSLLPLRSEGQLLNWCIEGTQTTANPGVWGLFHPLSVEHIVSEEISDRGQIERYCLALDLSPQNCARLSAVVQENGQSFSGAVWDSAHPSVAPPAGGNNVSLASRFQGRFETDGRVGPSCLALQFDPPWPPYTDLSFWWDLGHSGGGDAPAGVQVLLNHGPGDALLRLRCFRGGSRWHPQQAL